MLSTIHTIISLPFGIYFTNPILIFVSAVVFHLFADSILHWNIYPDEMKRFPFGQVALDVIGGLVIAFAVLGNTTFSLPILVAIAGGNFPDVLHTLWSLLSDSTRHKAPRWIQAVFSFHDALQLETRNVAHGLAPQILLAVVALLIVLTLS